MAEHIDTRLRKRMQVLLFYTFLFIFIATCTLTLLALFTGLVDLNENQEDLLVKATLVEVAAGVIALFYAVFGLRHQSKAPDDAKKSHGDLTYKTKTYSFILNVPDELPKRIFTRIFWDKPHCFLKTKEEKLLIEPASSEISPESLQIKISDSIVNKINQDDVISISLLDNKGNVWEVVPFFLFSKHLTLVPKSGAQKILKDFPTPDRKKDLSDYEEKDE